MRFLHEYYAAVALAARQVGGYRLLHEVLRLWRLVAVSQSDPGFEGWLAAVREAVAAGSLEGTVPIEDVVPAWPRHGSATASGSTARPWPGCTACPREAFDALVERVIAAVMPPGTDPAYRITAFGSGYGLLSFHADDSAEAIRIFDIA